MSILPKIDMVEVTRLTRAGRLLEATALLRGRQPHPGEQAAPTVDAPSQSNDAPEGAKPSTFTERSFANSAGNRTFKLFLPERLPGNPLPLVVMLHGCTQTPDDFAAGTRMNALAADHQVAVVYPAQSTAANSSRCWNWFNATDQVRDRGEPSIIAGITREIIGTGLVDPRRVYIAGLSAGGAAAATMAALYPDLYAAVCVHSGLACGAARDMMSAFGAMKGGGAASAVRGPGGTPVPTIVFHGDRDSTVAIVNGDQVVAQARGGAEYRASVTEGRGPSGQAYKRTVETDGRGRTMLEYWVLHGRGHAWSGGSAEGSFTDPDGIDASSEMLRFFRDHAL